MISNKLRQPFSLSMFQNIRQIFQKSFLLKVRTIQKLKRHLRIRSGFVLCTIEISVNIK